MIQFIGMNPLWLIAWSEYWYIFFWSIVYHSLQSNSSVFSIISNFKFHSRCVSFPSSFFLYLPRVASLSTSQSSPFIYFIFAFRTNKQNNETPNNKFIATRALKFIVHWKNIEIKRRRNKRTSLQWWSVLLPEADDLIHLCWTYFFLS